MGDSNIPHPSAIFHDNTGLLSTHAQNQIFENASQNMYIDRHQNFENHINWNLMNSLQSSANSTIPKILPNNSYHDIHNIYGHAHFHGIVNTPDLISTAAQLSQHAAAQHVAQHVSWGLDGNLSCRMVPPAPGLEIPKSLSTLTSIDPVISTEQQVLNISCTRI